MLSRPRRSRQPYPKCLSSLASADAICKAGNAVLAPLKTITAERNGTLDDDPQTRLRTVVQSRELAALCTALVAHQHEAQLPGLQDVPGRAALCA